MTGGADRRRHGHRFLESGGGLGVCAPILGRRGPREHDVDGLAALGEPLDDPPLDRAYGIASALAPAGAEPLIEDSELEAEIVGLDQLSELPNRGLMLPRRRKETGHDQTHRRVDRHRIR